MVMLKKEKSLMMRHAFIIQDILSLKIKKVEKVYGHVVL
jgi:hypothetical protein